MEFSELRRANALRASQWNNGSPTSLEFCMIELGGETGEALDAVKKLLRHQRGMPGGVEGIEPIAEELADVVICADLAAMKLGIDLSAAIARKFNKTSRKHGFSILLQESTP